MMYLSADRAKNANLICDGFLLKKLLGAGMVWLEQNHEHVNRLNVFPVPDGDTGTNMLLTMREAYRAIEQLEEPHAGKVAQAFARGALNGARGNSGTILSQLWRGVADALRDHSTFGAEPFARACRDAVAMAYKAVSAPTEGTILTVAREAMEAVTQRVEDRGESDLVTLSKLLLISARASLRHTPELLPVLKQAGVVDSGGQGLVYIFEGMYLYSTGQPLVAQSHPVEEAAAVPADWQQALEPDDAEGYGYDVQFRIHGTNLDVEAVRRAIEDIGWSTVVAGDRSLIKVHVHVHDPGRPISYAIGLGADIDDVVVENMQMQYHEFVQARLEREEAESNASAVGVVVVAPGAGMRKLFLEQLGAARVISGGQTMNPSTGELLDAIYDLPHEHIVLLPNNKNIILTAQQAANAEHGKTVRVVPSRTLPQGISAMLALGNIPDVADADEAAEEMNQALKHVISAEITTATRSVELGGVSVQAGQLIGLLEGNLVVAGHDMLTVMRDLLNKANADRRELITLYFGNDTHKAKAQALVVDLSRDFPEQTFEIVYGGQALYPYIISIE